jgi:hypothetical protein
MAAPVQEIETNEENQLTEELIGNIRQTGPLPPPGKGIVLSLASRRCLGAGYLSHNRLRGPERAIYFRRYVMRPLVKS